RPWSLHRGLARQQPPRAAERAVRKSAVAFHRWTTRCHCSLGQAAALLRLAPRTLAAWELAWRCHRLHPQPPGRPQRRAPRLLRHDAPPAPPSPGPTCGLPTPQGLCPSVPRQELADLLRRFRRVYLRDHKLLVHVLHWHRPGAVWAVDFCDAPTPIEGH